MSLIELGLFAGVALPDAIPFLRKPRTSSSHKAHLCVFSLLLASYCFTLAPSIERGIDRGDFWTVLWMSSLLVALAAAMQRMNEMLFMRGSRMATVREIGSNAGALFGFVGFLVLHPSQRHIGILSRIDLTFHTLLQGLGYLLLFLCGWTVLTPSATVDERSYGEAARSIGGDWRWIVASMGRFPFETVEGLAWMKLMDKGLPVDILAVLKGLECLPALISGIFVHHGLPSRYRRLAWISAYYLRMALAGALTYFLTLLPKTLTLSHTTPFLTIYAVLSCASISLGNMLLTLQQIWIEEERVSQPPLRQRWLSRINISHVLMRMAALGLSDVMSHRVCVRQEQQFRNVPCPIPFPFASHINNLCTVSGGACHVVSDGFPLVSYTSLIVGVIIGPLLYRSMRDHPRRKRGMK